MIDKNIDVRKGDTPIIAFAIHGGHDLRKEVKPFLALDELSRLREEDPFTDLWTAVADNRVVVRTSRFEVDLNRAKQKAVYIEPEDAWGLNVWKEKLSADIIQKSLDKWESFYSEAYKILTDLHERLGKFVVLDLHSYNYRRLGPASEPADPEANPEVNIGTGTMNRELWAPVVTRFIGDLSQCNFLDRHLDVRENIKFKGGNFSRWVHETFPDEGCCLAVEFKKTFMDEWTGRLDKRQHAAISKALGSTIPGLCEELIRL